MGVDVDCRKLVSITGQQRAEWRRGLPVSLWMYVQLWKQANRDPDAALHSISSNSIISTFTNHTPIASLNKVIVLPSKLQSPDMPGSHDKTKLTAAKSLHHYQQQPLQILQMSHPPNSFHSLNCNVLIFFSPVASLEAELLLRPRAISAQSANRLKTNLQINRRRMNNPKCMHRRKKTKVR